MQWKHQSDTNHYQEATCKHNYTDKKLWINLNIYFQIMEKKSLISDKRLEFIVKTPMLHYP